MNLEGKKTYISGALIAIIGLLTGLGIYDIPSAEAIITVLLGIMGMSLRSAIGSK